MRPGSNLGRGDEAVENLAPFVPGFARQLISATPFREPVSSPSAGVVLVADLVGFTSLTESLAQRGQDGIERIQHVLNTCFARLVSTIESDGGEVIRFAGDSVIAWWPALRESLGDTATRAMETATALQRLTPELERAAAAPLRLRVALAAGDCWTALVGGENDRWEAVLGGDVFAQLAAIGSIGIGDVGCSVEFARQAGKRWDGERGTGSRELRTGNWELLKALVPRHLVARIADGQQGSVSELRTVSVLFATVPSSRNAARDPHAAHDVSRAMQRAVYAHGGSVVQVVVDDRGEFVFIAAWGVPGSSYSDNAERAVRAARAMSDSLKSGDASPNIGIASGQVFSGLRGGPTRLEYALIGRVVNLAARLMRAADGRVLCDTETTRAAAAIEFASQPTLDLKGVGATEAFVPTERTQGQSSGFRVLVGRTAELAWLRGGLRDAAGSAPVVMFVEAEAGMGKSHLIDAFVRSAKADGVRVAIGAAEPLDAFTPYGGLQFVVAPLLGIDPREPAAARVQRVRALLPDASAADRLPLLSPLLGIALPETALTSEMRGHARADALADLIVQLVHASRTQAQRLLIVDDAQWMDASSWAVLEQIVRRSRDVCVVLAARPRATFPPPIESEAVLGGHGVRRLELSALAADDADGIIADTLGASKGGLPAALVEFIRERTHGQPLFVRQLAGALRDSSVIRVDGDVVTWDAAALRNLRLPTTVQGIVAARFDRLTPDQQRALKVACVFGRTFLVDAVAALMKGDQAGSALRSVLDPIVDEGILRRPEASTDALMFEHALVRDAVYDLVPPARRRELHGAAAAWLERKFGEDATYIGRIATHYKDAHDRANAPRTLERAGELALKSGAYRESASAFDTLIVLARTGFDAHEPHPIEVTPAELARWHWKLGVSHYDLGALGSARSALEAAAALHGERVPQDEKAAGARLIGDFARYVSGRVFPQRVRPRPDDDRARAVARILNILGRIYHLNQLPSLTLYTITSRYNLLNHRPATAESMLALSGMTFLATILGREKLAEEFVARVKTIQAAVDSPAEFADALYPITVTRLGQGAWAPCAEESREALEIVTRLGERKGRMNQMAVLANLAEMCGDFPRSLELYSDLLRMAEEDTDELSQVWALGGLGMIAMRAGDLAAAGEWASKACVASLAASETVSYLSNLGTRAGARWRGGDFAGARALVLEGLPLLERTPKYSTAHHNLNAFDMFAETALALIESGDRGADVQRCAAVACDRLRRYARTFPIGRPMAAVWSAVETRVRGQRAGNRLFDRVISEAERIGIPFDLGRAHLEAARYGATDTRSIHIDAAERIFESLGAPVELERVRSLRA